jgi:hypothetical protein
MPRMLNELFRQPELGFLHGEFWFSRTILVLLAPMDHLLAYANKEAETCQRGKRSTRLSEPTALSALARDLCGLTWTLREHSSICQPSPAGRYAALRSRHARRRVACRA